MDITKEVLGHPLLILFTGALLTGLVIPRITRRWHTHQKALEIRTDLVSAVSKSIMEIIMAVQYARLRAPSQTQADFDAAYRQWEIESAVIGTKLHAYFPLSHLPAAWTTFSERVTDFYAIEGARPEERRSLECELWKKLKHKDPLPEGDAGWLSLKNAIFTRKGEMLADILKADISVLK
jgi:hypothetical protein